MNREVVYEVVVYRHGADATGVQHIMLLRTPDEQLARFLAAQALLLPRPHPGEQQESVRYCAELRRGHHSGPLDSGSWRPTHPPARTTRPATSPSSTPIPDLSTGRTTNRPTPSSRRTLGAT